MADSWLDANIPSSLHQSGDYDPEAPLDDAFVRQVVRLTSPVVRYFRTKVEGAWRLPRDQGALLISNHAILGIDSMVFFPALYEETGRLLRGLADHHLFKIPLLNQLVTRMGAVDGRRDNAIAMLRDGHWGICYPGGSQDSFKTMDQRYRLPWHGRMGYLRVALASGVPIVPVAGIGIDDAYVGIGKERQLGRALFGKPRYDLPILVGLGPMPLPVKFRFVIDEPIDPASAFGLSPEHADAPDEVLLEAHLAIWTHTQQLIDRELQRRLSPFF